MKKSEYEYIKYDLELVREYYTRSMGPNPNFQYCGAVIGISDNYCWHCGVSTKENKNDKQIRRLKND